MFENIPTYVFYFLLFYLALTVSLYVLSASVSNPTIRQSTSFFARTLASYASLCACATYGVAASIYLRSTNNHRISQWTTARSFHHLMYWTTGVRFDIVSGGSRLNDVRPAVLIGNHQSALDVLLLAAIWPKYCSVTAKSSLRRAPFLGWFMALSGTVFIDRADRSSAIKAFEGAAKEIRSARQSVFIFPEGTRHPAPEPVLGGFKKGAFHLAVQAGVPIVPVVCANYWGLLSIKERRFRAGRIPVKVLDPIPTTGLTAADVDRLTQETKELMQRELVNLTATPEGRAAISPDGSGMTGPANGILKGESINGSGR